MIWRTAVWVIMSCLVVSESEHGLPGMLKYWVSRLRPIENHFPSQIKFPGHCACVCLESSGASINRRCQPGQGRGNGNNSSAPRVTHCQRDRVYGLRVATHTETLQLRADVRSLWAWFASNYYSPSVYAYAWIIASSESHVCQMAPRQSASGYLRFPLVGPLPSSHIRIYRWAL